MTAYDTIKIAAELQATALGEAHFGNALRVAKDIPGMTPGDLSVLDKFATGTQSSSDGWHLQAIAVRIAGYTPAAPGTSLQDRLTQAEQEITAYNLTMDRQSAEIVALKQRRDSPGAAPSIEELTDIISQHLTSVYLCGRVWAAWDCGTMTQDDFTGAEDTDLPVEMAAAIHARLTAAVDATPVPC